MPKLRFGALRSFMTRAMAAWTLAVVGFSASSASADPSCEGSHVVLGPKGVPLTYWGIADEFVKGLFVTALTDFEICSVSIAMLVEDSVVVDVYAASGTTRGALLATGAAYGPDVILDQALEACEDYEIVVRRIPTNSTTAAFGYYPYGTFTYPFDCGGALRVRARDTTLPDPTPTALYPIILIGRSLGATNQDVTPIGPPNDAPALNLPEFGFFFRAKENAQICGAGVNADFVPGQVLHVEIATASEFGGTFTKGGTIGAGSITTTASGLQWHDVPVNARLLAGNLYAVNVSSINANQIVRWFEAPAGGVTVPFTHGPFSVVKGLWNGASNTDYFSMRFAWLDDQCGVPFTWIKPDEPLPPHVLMGGFGSYGAYITSVLAQDVFALGWMADVPEGTQIIARVFAANGMNRGPLLSEGIVYSTSAGMRWHDIPVAADFEAGQMYDVSIEFANVNLAHYWDDTTGLPFPVQGALLVLNGEQFGDPLSNVLVQMRLTAANDLPTNVDAPRRVPLMLRNPAPNPASGRSRVEFDLEEGGVVTLQVFDVTGRLVATLLKNEERSPGWHAAEIDATHLASGVYFVKLATQLTSVSRKFVVAH